MGGHSRNACNPAVVVNEYQRLKAHRKIVAAWVRRFGPLCPGWRRRPHWVAIKDLTVDHIRPKSQGGSDRPSNLRVRCRSCNSRKHDKPDDPPVSGPQFPHPLRGQ